MPRNTTADLLKTIIPGGMQEFVCPACGVPMSLRNPGSFELNLTINARKEFNEVIRHYAAFLAYFEAEATSRNIASSTRNDAVPYAHTEREGLPPSQFTRGVYNTKGAAELRDHWWHRFDHYAFYRRVHEELAPIEELNQELAAARNTNAGTASKPTSRTYGGTRQTAGGSSSYGDDEKPFAAAVRVLLGGIEPLRMMGHVMSLAFDQPHVRRWLADVAGTGGNGGRHGSGSGDYLAKLAGQPEIAPTLSRYLDLLEEVLKDDGVAARLVGPEHAERTGKLLGELRRARLMLVLLLGHTSELVTKEFPGLVAHYVPFTLPQRVVVAPKFLPLLLESAAILDRSGLHLSGDYVDLLKGDGLGRGGDGGGHGAGLGAAGAGIGTGIGTGTGTAAGATQQSKSEAELIAQFVGLLGEDTHRMFTFVCRGPSGHSAELARKAAAAADKQRYAPQEPDICGWFPKADETHPVVFIGSPGTSKSTLMLTGLLQFYNNAQALGATVGFQSDKDLREYDKFVDLYWEGCLPDPTPAGARNSIQLRIESTTDPERGANFVFTDIAGEVTSRSVRGEGADPIVLGVLKHAETLVFLFDLSIEQAVQRQLEFSPAQQERQEWRALLDNYRSVISRRTDEAADPAASSEPPRSRARVSQLDLLERMISDLREIRGRDLRTDGPNFVCIVPKADLYTGSLADDRDGQESRIKFLTGFYSWLIDQNVLSHSPNGPRLPHPDADSGSDIGWYRSTAGYGWSGAADGEVGGALGREVVLRQLQLIREISDKAQESLGKIGDALGYPEAQDGQVPPSVRSLSDMVRSRLVDRLQSVFRREDVYFLPISAQGADLPAQEQAADAGKKSSAADKTAAKAAGDTGLGYPPNAKLSEYAFMLPIFLALRGSSDGVGGPI